MKIRLEDDKEMGTLVMQVSIIIILLLFVIRLLYFFSKLFCDLCPKTVDNFRSLCTGEKFTQDNERICYAGSCIHRVVPNGWIQAGGSRGMHVSIHVVKCWRRWGRERRRGRERRKVMVFFCSVIVSKTCNGMID